MVYNLSHANIVNTLSHELKRSHDMDTTAASHFKLYMIQEYCAGGTLANLVRHGHLISKEGGVRFERVLMLLRDVAAGLAHVHSQDIGAFAATQPAFHQRCSQSPAQHLTALPTNATSSTGAVHGNLNPANVLLQVPPSERAEEHHDFLNGDHAALLAARALDSEQCTAKISDFGLSVQHQEAMWLPSQEHPAAQVYTAPELQHDSYRTHASDAYAFGVRCHQSQNHQNLADPVATSLCIGHGGRDLRCCVPRCSNVVYGVCLRESQIHYAASAVQCESRCLPAPGK